MAFEDLRARLLPDGQPTSATPGWTEVSGTLSMTDSAYQAWVKRAEKEIIDRTEHGGTTLAQFSDGNGEYVPDRVKQHEQIVDSVVAKAETFPKGRRSIMTAGRPGSGKSRYFAEDTDFFYLDCDLIKRDMIGLGMAPVVDGLTPFETAGLIHQESNHITMQIFNRLVILGVNLLLEQTMSSPKYSDTRMSRLRRNSYNIRGVLMQVSFETSYRRCQERHRRGLEEFLLHGTGLGGRLIPRYVCEQSSDGVFGFYARHSKFDTYEKYTNDVDNAEPEGVGSGGNEKEMRKAYEAQVEQFFAERIGEVWNPLTGGTCKMGQSAFIA